MQVTSDHDPIKKECSPLYFLLFGYFSFAPAAAAAASGASESTVPAPAEHASFEEVARGAIKCLYPAGSRKILCFTTPSRSVHHTPPIQLHRARSIWLIWIRIRWTPPFSDYAFDWAHPNPDESSELIRLIRKNYG